MEFETAAPERAAALRSAFIAKFIDTESGYYQKHIAAVTQAPDGPFYDGFLWDCLRDNRDFRWACSMDDAVGFLEGRDRAFAMWDSRARSDKRFSREYPRGTVIRMQGGALGRLVAEEWNREQAAWRADCQCQGLWFPEDLYCFDKSMDWCAIFTHEGWDSWDDPELGEDAYIRICFLCL